MIIVLGAGIAGISAAYHLKIKGHKAIIYEKSDYWGGLCGNFVVDGFRFDHAIHLSFAKNEHVKSLFSKSTTYFIHKPKSSNYFNGYWAKHPIQNNLYPLPVDIKVNVIKDFIKNDSSKEKIENYEDWLKAQYGEYFSKEFPMKYTKKYWCCDAKDLSTTWVGDRMYKPNIEEVLKGAMSENTPNTYYAGEMRYPKKGGYKSFLKGMRKECSIKIDHEVTTIDPENKFLTFSNGYSTRYNKLISTIPLPEYAKLIKNIPKNIIEACKKLTATSVGLVSIGLNNQDNKYPKKNDIWHYIYDEDILAARCYSPSEKSSDNAPINCYSYQFEIYFNDKKPMNLDKENIIEHILDSAEKMNMFDKSDVIVSDYRFLKYGNVVFYKGMEEDRKQVLDYLNSISIGTAGRFGEWDYLWSDQSLLSGKKAAENVSVDI